LTILNTCDELGKARRQLLRKFYSFYSNIVDIKFVLDKTVYKKGQKNFSCFVQLKDERKFGDIMFLDTKEYEQGWTKLPYKLEKMINYIADHHNFEYRYIFKTDDDSLIRLDIAKKHTEETIDKPYLSQNRDIKSQEMLAKKLFVYSGHFLMGSKVHKFAGERGDFKFTEDTGLDFYLPYAAGAGYFFSSAVANALNTWSRVSALNKWINEDATFGHWMSSMNHTRYHFQHYSFYGKCVPRSFLYHPVKEVPLMIRVIDAILTKNETLICEEYHY
jgi:hypothetical protein